MDVTPRSEAPWAVVCLNSPQSYPQLEGVATDPCRIKHLRPQTHASVRISGTLTPPMPASHLPDSPPLCRIGVVVEAPQHAGLWGPLDYLCERPLPAGTLVRVPFGRRVVTGVVWWGGDEVAPEATVEPAQLKEVAEVLDGLPPLPPAWRQLVRFAAAFARVRLGLAGGGATALSRRLRRRSH